MRETVNQEQKPIEAHVLWEGKAANYSNSAHVYRVVALHKEPDLCEGVDHDWDDVRIVAERRSVDALGSPIWVGDGCLDGPVAVALAHLIIQGPHNVPEWLRVWYMRQRALPIAPLR